MTTPCLLQLPLVVGVPDCQMWGVNDNDKPWNQHLPEIPSDIKNQEICFLKLRKTKAHAQSLHPEDSHPSDTNLESHLYMTIAA